MACFTIVLETSHSCSNNSSAVALFSGSTSKHLVIKSFALSLTKLGIFEYEPFKILSYVSSLFGLFGPAKGGIPTKTSYVKTPIAQLSTAAPYPLSFICFNSSPSFAIARDDFRRHVIRRA